MFSLFKNKKSRNGFWDKDKLYDLDTGLLLAELIIYKSGAANPSVSIRGHNSMKYQNNQGDQYQSKKYAMKAAEKYYNINNVLTIVPRPGSSTVE